MKEINENRFHGTKNKMVFTRTEKTVKKPGWTLWPSARKQQLIIFCEKLSEKTEPLVDGSISFSIHGRYSTMTRIIIIHLKVLLVATWIHYVYIFFLTLSLSVSLLGVSFSLHLLLDLVGVHIHDRSHLHGLAAAGADVFQETEVSAARHDDHDDDDYGGPEGWWHSAIQDRLEASHADPTRAQAWIAGSFTWKQTGC